MIRITKTSTFTADVYVRLPGAERDDSFKATYKHLNREQIKDLAADLRDGRLTDDDLLDRVLVGVSGIGDETGQPVDADTALAWVRSTPAAANAVNVAFFREMAGASEKNAVRSRGR